MELSDWLGMANAQIEIDRIAEIADLRQFISHNTHEQVIIEQDGENCYKVSFTDTVEIGKWIMDFFNVNGFMIVHFGVATRSHALYVVFNVTERRNRA